MYIFKSNRLRIFWKIIRRCCYTIMAIDKWKRVFYSKSLNVTQSKKTRFHLSIAINVYNSMCTFNIFPIKYEPFIQNIPDEGCFCWNETRYPISKTAVSFQSRQQAILLNSHYMTFNQVKLFSNIKRNSRIQKCIWYCSELNERFNFVIDENHCENT